MTGFNDEILYSESPVDLGVTTSQDGHAGQLEHGGQRGNMTDNVAQPNGFGSEGYATEHDMQRVGQVMPATDFLEANPQESNTRPLIHRPAAAVAADHCYVYTFALAPQSVVQRILGRRPTRVKAVVSITPGTVFLARDQGALQSAQAAVAPIPLPAGPWYQIAESTGVGAAFTYESIDELFAVVPYGNSSACTISILDYFND